MFLREAICHFCVLYMWVNELYYLHTCIKNMIDL